MWGAQGEVPACGQAAQAALGAAAAGKAAPTAYHPFDRAAAHGAGQRLYEDVDQYVLDCTTKQAGTHVDVRALPLE